MNIDYKKMPKVHLHCHMDGSCSIDFVQSYMKSQGKEYSKEMLVSELTAPMDCASLADYLARFTLPLACLQTREGLKGMAEDVLLNAWDDGVKYIELRFAPTSSLESGLSLSEIIEAVLEGCQTAQTKCGIDYGVIVCTMRHLGNEAGMDMLKVAREYLGSGIVACDIAGDEKSVSNIRMADYMNFARRMDFPMTIHAGECGSADSVMAAVKLGAKRIGHGVAMSGHSDIIKLCRDRHVGIELCPTSNLQTKAVDCMENYPFTEFLKKGLMLSVNTDNSTVSATSCSGEFERLDKYFHLNRDLLEKIYKDSVEMSFASDDIKHKLLKAWSL